MADKKTNPWVIVGIVVVAIFLFKNVELFKIFPDSESDLLNSNYVLKYTFDQSIKNDFDIYTKGYGYLILEGPVDLDSPFYFNSVNMKEMNSLATQLNSTPIFSNYLMGIADTGNFEPKDLDLFIEDIEKSKDNSCDAIDKGAILGVIEFEDWRDICNRLPEDLFHTETKNGIKRYVLNSIPDFTFTETHLGKEVLTTYELSKVDLILYTKGDDLFIAINEGIDELENINFREDFVDYEKEIIHKDSISPSDLDNLEGKTGYTVISNNKEIVKASDNIFLSTITSLFTKHQGITISSIIIILIIIGGIIILSKK